ncbi:hypothetical protein TNCV_4005951 [Trichonephila clavipes]|nr:hypothetical protein TNCV_4005951 [Trichonephila clavipes]
MENNARLHQSNIAKECLQSEDITRMEWPAFSPDEITLNSRRAPSPLVRLVEGEERSEAPGHLQGVLSQNWGGQAKSFCDRRKTLTFSRVEFHGP